MKLNLGSGDHRAPAPWINLDSWPGTNPDVVASAERLPFANNSIRYVYAGHVLEHLAHPQIALVEIRRVLYQFGGICIVGPDLDRIRTNPDWQDLLDPIIYGGQRWPGDIHLHISTAQSTLNMCRGIFSKAWEIPIADVPEGWPVVDRSAGWQFAILAW